MATIREQQKHAMKQGLLTVEQFALLTQYHVWSVYRLIRTGKLPIVRIDHGRILIERPVAKVWRARHPRADQSLAL